VLTGPLCVAGAPAPAVEPALAAAAFGVPAGVPCAVDVCVCAAVSAAGETDPRGAEAVGAPPPPGEVERTDEAICPAAVCPDVVGNGCPVAGCPVESGAEPVPAGVEPDVGLPAVPANVGRRVSAAIVRARLAASFEALSGSCTFNRSFGSAPPFSTSSRTLVPTGSGVEGRTCTVPSRVASFTVPSRATSTTFPCRTCPVRSVASPESDALVICACAVMPFTVLPRWLLAAILGSEW